jgi:hypothetical protein
MDSQKVGADTPTTITLGGKQYPVAKMTMKQMRRAGPCIVRSNVDTVEGMDAQATVILLAMQAADPSMTMEKLDAVPATFAEISAAYVAICAVEGFSVVKDDGAGEAKPGAGPAQDGDSPALDWRSIYAELRTACGYTTGRNRRSAVDGLSRSSPLLAGQPADPRSCKTSLHQAIEI